MKVHNTSTSARAYWNPQKNKRLTILPGIQEISEEDLAEFGHKFEADSSIFVDVKPINGAPLENVKEEVIEEPVTTLEVQEEEEEEVPAIEAADDSDDKPKRGKKS